MDTRADFIVYKLRFRGKQAQLCGSPVSATGFIYLPWSHHGQCVLHSFTFGTSFGIAWICHASSKFGDGSNGIMVALIYNACRRLGTSTSAHAQGQAAHSRPSVDALDEPPKKKRRSHLVKESLKLGQRAFEYQESCKRPDGPCWADPLKQHIHVCFESAVSIAFGHHL